MSFVSRLRPELIAIAPPWRGFPDTIEGLMATLVAAGALAETQRAGAVRAVVAREGEASTAVLDIGIGVPHARLDGLGKTVVALALSPDGLYEPVPTVPIRIVALVLSPPDAGNDHLQTLAGIATLLRSGPLRQALLGASEPAAALRALGRASRSAP